MPVDFDNNVPIYVQLVEQFKIEIISGKLKPGERLPSVRDLAMQMKVNPNTMQKALSELEDLQLIYTERTNGKFVTEDCDLIEKFKREYAIQLSKSFLFNMKNIGLDYVDVIDYLQKNGGDE